jgi:hypothetical protein
MVKEQKKLIRNWRSMWKRILDDYGVEGVWGARINDINRALVAHFQHALLFDWPSGDTSSRSKRILRTLYTRGYLPASVQLATQAALSGFWVDIPNQIRINEWTYTRIRFHPMNIPNQDVVEYIVRYSKDANLKIESFQVLAESVAGGKYQPYGHSVKISLPEIWTSIKNNIVPKNKQFSAVEAFLNDLCTRGVLHVGGEKTTSQWVENLREFIPGE